MRKFDTSAKTFSGCLIELRILTHETRSGFRSADEGEVRTRLAKEQAAYGPVAILTYYGYLNPNPMSTANHTNTFAEQTYLI